MQHQIIAVCIEFRKSCRAAYLTRSPPMAAIYLCIYGTKVSDCKIKIKEPTISKNVQFLLLNQGAQRPHRCLTIFYAETCIP